MTTDAVNLVLSVLFVAAFVGAAATLLALAGGIGRARAVLRRRLSPMPHRVPGSSGADADLARVLHDLDALRGRDAA